MASTAINVERFDIEYPGVCTECKKAGNEYRLRFSTESGIFCANPKTPHSFATLAEGEGSAQAAPVAQEVAEVKLGSGFDDRVYAGTPTRDGLSQGDRSQQRADRLRENLQEAMREQARKGTRSVETPPAPAREPAGEEVVRRDVAKDLARESAGPVKTVQVLDTKALPAGELAVTVILRERHLSAVAAEASVQKRTVGEELERFLEAALDSFWGQV